jgi:hypothetical protein
MLDTGADTVLLSSFGSLDQALFKRLLELLGGALTSRPDRSGTRRTTTTDGRIEIVLKPARRGGIAEITTPLGEFRGPDYEVEIRTSGLSAVRRASGDRS